MTMSQMTSLVNAPNAAVKGSVRVATVAVRPRNAHAPTGSGPRTSPAMVDRKMERSCHACGVTSGGRGARKRTARPTAREASRGSGFAPATAAAGAGAGLGFGPAAWAADAEARVGGMWRRGVWERWGVMGKVRLRERELGEGWRWRWRWRRWLWGVGREIKVEFLGLVWREGGRGRAVKETAHCPPSPSPVLPLTPHFASPVCPGSDFLISASVHGELAARTLDPIPVFCCAGMDFGGGIGDQSEMWAWQSQEYDLQKDLFADPSSSLWGEANQNVGDAWSMFDEQTPIKHCTDIDFQLCDIGDIIVKDFDEGKETLQAKRRRMLQFCSENVEMQCPMTEDGFSENLQVNLDFSSDECLLNCDGTEELPEEWLVDCSQDSEHQCLPEEMNSPTAAMEKANLSLNRNSLPREQANIIQKNPLQSRPTPLKAGKNIIRARKFKTSVAYPFELIKPCGFHGDVTLNDINQRIHAPPPYKIKHKKDDEPVSYQTSAISGKPVVHKTKIHTEGGKGSITITRTRG